MPHSNQCIRFYTYQTTLAVLDCTPTFTFRPNARPSLPPPRPPVQTDSRRPRPSEAGAVLTQGPKTVLTTRTLSAPRDERGLAIRPDTRPIRETSAVKPTLPFIEETRVEF